MDQTKIESSNHYIEQDPEDILLSIQNGIKDVLKRSKINPDEIVNLAPYYGELEKLESTPLILTKEDKLFGGTIIGQKGSFLVLQDDKTPLAINLNYLIGFDVEFLAEKPERAGQKSLMDFF